MHGAQVRRCVHVQRCGGTEVQRRRRRTVSTKIASLPSERWARRECVSSDAKSTSDTRPLRLGRGASRSCGRARTGLGRSAESVGALRRSRRRVGGDRSRSPPAARSCPRSCSPRERSAASAAPRPRRARAPCRAARWSGPRPRSASAAGGCASASARSASRAAPGRMRLGEVSSGLGPSIRAEDALQPAAAPSRPARRACSRRRRRAAGPVPCPPATPLRHRAARPGEHTQGSPGAAAGLNSRGVRVPVRGSMAWAYSGRRGAPC